MNELRKLLRNFICNDGNASVPPDCDERKGIRVVSGEQRKLFRFAAGDFHDLRHASACFLVHNDIRNFFRHPEHCCRFDVAAGSAGNIIDDNGNVDGFGNSGKMPEITFLSRFIVIRADNESCVCSGVFCERAFSIASLVLLLPAPAKIFTRPRA